MLQLQTWMDLFDVQHAFLQLRGIGLFGTKRAYANLENPTYQEIFLSKITSILTRKQCAR
jgi:hypothetical protein